MKIRLFATTLLLFTFITSARVFPMDKITLSSTNPTALEMDQIIAREKGFLARENVDVELTYMQPDLVIKALIAGTVDVARSGTHFGIIPAARGADVKIIGGVAILYGTHVYTTTGV